ncbi:hypothetical protein AM593_02685, partial [Mytilus galloprovincialis]
APLKNVVSHDKIRYQNDNTLQGGPRKHKTELRKHSPNGEMRPPPVKRQVSHGAIKTQSSTRPISKDVTHPKTIADTADHQLGVKVPRAIIYRRKDQNEMTSTIQTDTNQM